MELSNEELDSILARAGLKLAQPYHPSGSSESMMISLASIQNPWYTYRRI